MVGELSPPSARQNYQIGFINVHVNLGATEGCDEHCFKILAHPIPYTACNAAMSTIEHE